MVLPSLTATKEPDNIQKWHRIRTSREERDKKTRVKETASTANLETKLPLQTSVIQFNEVHDRELIPFCDLSESILYNYFSQWLKIISHRFNSWFGKLLQEYEDWFYHWKIVFFWRISTVSLIRKEAFKGRKRAAICYDKTQTHKMWEEFQGLKSREFPFRLNDCKFNSQ